MDTTSHLPERLKVKQQSTSNIRRMWKNWTAPTLLGEHKMVQLLLIMAWLFLINLNTNLITHQLHFSVFTQKKRYAK